MKVEEEEEEEEEEEAEENNDEGDVLLSLSKGHTDEHSRSGSDGDVGCLGSWRERLITKKKKKEFPFCTDRFKPRLA